MARVLALALILENGVEASRQDKIGHVFGIQ